MKKIYLILLILLLSLSLFAQGTKEKDETTITWWHSNSGILGDVTEELVDEFNNTIGKDEGIYVEAIYQGKANDVLTKVKAAASSGDTSALPDIAQLDSTGVTDMGTSPYIYFVEDLAKDNGEDLSFLLSSAIESMRYKGKVIGLPFNASTLLYYYNKSAFEEAGVTVPKTFDELINIAPSLVVKDEKGEVKRYALSLVPTTYELITFIGSQKGLSYLTDNENGHLGTPTHVLFDSEGTLKTFLEKWEELYKTGALNNQTSGISADFAAGNTTSMMASSSNLTSVLEAVDGRFEVGVAPVPRVNEEATGGVNIGGGALFTFNKDSEKEKAVWSFMKYLTSAEVQLKWHEETGYLPVNKDTYTLEGYKQHTEENPIFAVASDQLLASNPKLVSLWIPAAYQVYYSFQSGIKKMLEEGVSIDDTVSSMANEINGYLNEFNKQNID